MKILTFLMLLIMAHASAYADCYDDAANKYDIDPMILRAITLKESTNHPYAINFSGRSFYPDSYEEAIRIIESIRPGVTFDIGLQQVNKFWLDKFYNGQYHIALDACFNIELSAAILHYENQFVGSIWKAVGRYHSKNPALATKYVSGVMKKYNYLLSRQ